MKESRYNLSVEYGNSVYVFNGISGALLGMALEDYHALRGFLDGERDSSCSAQLIEKLVIGRMLIPDDCDELDLLAKRYEFSRNASSRFTLTILTSLGCNFDCPYCFEAKHPSIMEKAVQEAILKVLEDQLPKIERFTVIWFGGEPLVGKKPLLALSDAFIERCDRFEVKYDADITTNGYLLDKETCVQLYDRRVTRIQVCLDGPPEVHDRMRPLANGKGSFWRIIENLHHAIEYFKVRIRMNVDKSNFGYAEGLLKILSAEGFAGKLTVYPGQIVGVNDGAPSPSATYKQGCFRNREYAQAELEFKMLAEQYRFLKPSLPRPLGAPCTAVRKNELVVGSKGELYKCFESVGNSFEVIGHIFDYQDANGRLQKWLKYNPFENEECCSCLALPVCMGGCAHHAMDSRLYDNRCGTFRHTYREQILKFIKVAEQTGSTQLVPSGQLAQHVEMR